VRPRAPFVKQRQFISLKIAVSSSPLARKFALSLPVWGRGENLPFSRHLFPLFPPVPNNAGTGFGLKFLATPGAVPLFPLKIYIYSLARGGLFFLFSKTKAPRKILSHIRSLRGYHTYAGCEAGCVSGLSLTHLWRKLMGLLRTADGTPEVDGTQTRGAQGGPAASPAMSQA
jgi:hypothetical protein